MVANDLAEHAGKIVGVGTNGKLYTCENLYDAPKKAHDPGGKVKDICFMKDGTILGIGAGDGLSDGCLYTRADLNSSWKPANDAAGCVFKRVSLRKDGTILGVGTDNHMYTIPHVNLGSTCTVTHVLPNEQYAVWDAVEMDDMSILAVGTDMLLYKKANINASGWSNIRDSGSVVTATMMEGGSILAIGTNGRLWSRRNIWSPWYLAERNKGNYLAVAYCRRPQQPMLGISNGKLVRRETIYEPWESTPAVQGTIKSIGWMADGTMIAIGLGDGLNEGKIYTRDNLNSAWVKRYDKGAVFHRIAMRGSEMVLLGTNKYLYTLADFDSFHERMSEPTGQAAWEFNDISVMDDGSLLAIGQDNTCYTRRNIDCKWEGIGCGDLQAVTVMENGAICGVGVNSDLVTKETFQSDWVKAPHDSSVWNVQYCHRVQEFNDMKEVKPLILLITRIYCNVDSAESGNDDVYFRIFKDGAIEPEVLKRDSPIKMHGGDECYCDIEIDCTYLNRLMIQLGEKDSGSNSDDTLGDFYFDRNCPIDGDGYGSITANQTTGSAKAQYTLKYRVISKPIPTLRIFGLKCHKSTAGCNEDLVDSACELASEIVGKAGKVVGKSPRPRAKAVSKGMAVASELISEFAADIIKWICDKAEGSDDVVIQHVGVTDDQNGGNMLSSCKNIKMDDPPENLETLWKDDTSMVFFDTAPYEAGPNAHYIRIPLDGEDVTVQLKEHDWFKETGMGRITVTRQMYKDFAEGPMEMIYMDEYLTKNVSEGEGCLYSMAYSVGEENWAANATAIGQNEQRVFDNIKDAQECLKSLREKHHCIVPINAYNERGEIVFEAKDPKEYLVYDNVPQKDGGKYWFKYWSNDEDVERLKVKGEQIFEEWSQDNTVFGNRTVWVYVNCNDDWDAYKSNHTQIDLTHNDSMQCSTNGVRAIIQVDGGVANHNEHELVYESGGKKQGDGTGWNVNFGNGSSDLEELRKRAEMITCHFVVVGIY